MRSGRLLVVPTLVAVTAWTAAPATPARSPAKQVRFRATLAATVEFSHRSFRSYVDGGCTITSSSGYGNRLELVSGNRSILAVDKSVGALRGTLRQLVGSHHAGSSSAQLNSCTRQGVIGDGCMSPPKELSDGKVAVFAKGGQAVGFSTIIFPSWGCGEHRDLAGALNLARGTLTRGHLLRRRTIAVTGSYENTVTSSDGTEHDSTSVTWTLTLVRVR
jgi:hypothetical protein